jgi:hypothetical protein
MSYRKRSTSLEVLKAQERNNKVKSIDPNFDFGSQLNPQSYADAIARVVDFTDQYNSHLAEVDGVLVNLMEAEKELADMSQRVLNSVGSKYGYDSPEYEKAGGTRKSDRKRTTKKADNSATDK